METRYVETAEYDQWNRFVDESPQGEVFCYSWWLEAVTKGDFRILAVWEKDRIAAGILLPFLGAKKVNEPYLTRTLGVLYAKPGNESPRKRLTKERYWLNSLLDQVNRQHFVQMCMHHDFTDWLPFRWRGFKQMTRYTYLLDYSKTPIDDIWANMSHMHRKNVRKALNSHLIAEEVFDLESAYEMSCLSFARQGKRFPYSLESLRTLDDAVRERGHRTILRIVDGNHRIHAANYVVHHRKSAYHLLSGGDPQLRSMGGHTLLLWHTIKFFSDKVPVFNFGGSDLQPIEEHIRTFGGIQRQYFHIYNEDLLKIREGWKHHGAMMMRHAKEMLRDVRTKSLKQGLAFVCELLQYLLVEMKNRISSIWHG